MRPRRVQIPPKEDPKARLIPWEKCSIDVYQQRREERIK